MGRDHSTGVQHSSGSEQPEMEGAWALPSPGTKSFLLSSSNPTPGHFWLSTHSGIERRAQKPIQPQFCPSCKPRMGLAHGFTL